MSNTERVLKPMNDLNQGSIKFIRPSELAASGITGVVAEGIYEGTTPNNFEANRNDFKVRTEAGELLILNTAGSLASQLSRVETGTYVRVTYKGKSKIKSGPQKGKSAHNFLVEAEVTES